MSGLASALPAGVVLRPITEADLSFLFRLYASTREEELATIVDWTLEQKSAFLRQQFAAQHAWYQEHYAGASFDVVAKNELGEACYASAAISHGQLLQRGEKHLFCIEK